MNKKIILPIYAIIAIIISQIYSIKLVSYFGMILILGFSFITIFLFILSKTENKILFVILTTLSDVSFILYLYLGITTPEATSIGDLNILPILLFVISTPFIILMHSILIIRMFSKDNKNNINCIE